MPFPSPSIKTPYWKPYARTSSYKISNLDVGTAFNNSGATGNIVLTLPKAGNSAQTSAGGPGSEFIFLVASAHTITVTPVTGDTIRGKAASASATNSTVGSLLWLVCIVPGYWEPIVNNGAW
jgi:hypothetical protein